MAIIRKHWLPTLLGSVLLILVIVSGYSLRPAHAETSGNRDAVLDEYSKSVLKQIRSELALSDSELTAVGCNSRTKLAVFDSVESWYASSKEKLRSIDLQMAEADKNLHLLNDDSASMEYQAAAEQCRQLFIARQELLAGLTKSVESQLDYHQNTSWQAARNNRAMPDAEKFSSHQGTRQNKNIINQAKSSHRLKCLSK